MAKSSSISPARRVAFEILLRVEEGAYASILLATREEELKLVDRALCHELVMGVLRQQLWLDRLIEIYARRKVSDLDVGILVILRLGLYQLRFLSRIPKSAAVNESVHLVNFARLRSAGGLVNAVLRRATREPDVGPALTITDPIEKIAVTTSHPRWLIERWTNAFGTEEAVAFARANNQPAPVTFRIVGSRAGEEEVIRRLREAGAEPSPSQIASKGWRISGGGALLAELVREGKIYFQDEASQMVPEVLSVKQNDRVLDLCAAPGSKTTQIADQTPDLKTLIASDLHAHRLRTLSESARTQGLTNLRCVVLDALRPLPFEANSFDRVLVDAPCSGTGTLRRNPEIRWRISADDIEDLSSRQQQLLSNAAAVVKPAGRLVYSTCSVEPEENETVRQAFLERNSDFMPVNVELQQSVLTNDGCARTWPHRHDTDGFFVCAFERKTS